MKNPSLATKQKFLIQVIRHMTDRQADDIINYISSDKREPVMEAQPAVTDADCFMQLMSMTGCVEAKNNLMAMIADHRFAKIAAARKRKIPQPYYHMVFSGNPGCAKTTCARLYAKILAQEGITRENKYVELTRGAICGLYQGHTAANVRNIFKQNAGGVIFIDEAYSLFEDGPHNNATYGMEAINEIIVGLENNPGTVVIFAGYPEKMERFLKSNPGLRSRIPFRVRFDDYTTEELVEISAKIAREKGFEISESANAKLNDYFEIERKIEDFGNGRLCRSVVEQAIRNKGLQLGVMEREKMARCCDPNAVSDEVIFTLDEDCFDLLHTTGPKTAPRIGFD